ncbi:L,D-transpeptidase [Nocardia sp. NPDC049190]|uniref:L,D-transpeptidase n=1 Tax=Nocardia sp. NPDC049190 TaxID=3155650 RepID=UPI0033C7709A
MSRSDPPRPAESRGDPASHAPFEQPCRSRPGPVAPHREPSATQRSDPAGIPLSSAAGYIINGEFAECPTWGGVFIHSAPWSADQQGNPYVSHGCVTLAPSDAEWDRHHRHGRPGDRAPVSYLVDRRRFEARREQSSASGQYSPEEQSRTRPDGRPADSADNSTV